MKGNDLVTEVSLGEVRITLGETTPVSRFDAVVSVLFYSGKVALVKNIHRAWEFPGGRRQGDETYQETATREIFEEAGAISENIRLLGYYTDTGNHITLVACAEVSSFETPPESAEIVEVGFFNELPGSLSFGDGRERLFLEYARKTVSGHKSLRRDAVWSKFALTHQLI